MEEQKFEEKPIFLQKPLKNDKKVKNKIEDIFGELPQHNENILLKTMIVIDGMNCAIRAGGDKRFFLINLVGIGVL